MRRDRIDEPGDGGARPARHDAVDCHGAGKDGTFNSFIPELMECDWVSGHGWSRYTELLEKGCDAALMVGMHARSGTPDGVLCHTISTTTWRNLWFNDDLVGETGINAALCGTWGCPVVLVTGDEASVGPPWFDQYTVPLALILVLLSGIGPVIAWRRATGARRCGSSASRRRGASSTARPCSSRCRSACPRRPGCGPCASGTR